MTITTARLFDSYWEVASPDSEEDNSRAHRFQSASATTAKNRVHRQWHELAYRRLPIDGGYCELRMKIIHEVWCRRNSQNTRAYISTARRFGDDWPTSIPRASAPPPGWLVGRRSLGRLVGLDNPPSGSSSLAPTEAQTPQKQYPSWTGTYFFVFRSSLSSSYEI